MKDKLNSKLISEDKLETVNGGIIGLLELQKMKVLKYPYGPLGLMGGPAFTGEGKALCYLPAGTVVETDGTQTQGPDRYGRLCSYTFVRFQDQWGYAESNYLETFEYFK